MRRTQHSSSTFGLRGRPETRDDHGMQVLKLREHYCHHLRKQESILAKHQMPRAVELFESQSHRVITCAGSCPHGTWHACHRKPRASISLSSFVALRYAGRFVAALGSRHAYRRGPLGCTSPHPILCSSQPTNEALPRLPWHQLIINALAKLIMNALARVKAS